MKTYCLTIERLKRASKMVEELSANGFEFEFFNSVDCKDPDWESKVSVSEKGKAALTPGQICCAQGHLNLMQYVYDTGDAFAFIVEDDAKVTTTHDEIIALEKELPRNWDIALLSQNGTAKKKLFTGVEHTENFDRVSRTEYGSHGYLISRSGCRYFTRESSPIFTPIDCMFRYRAWAVIAFHLRTPVVFTHGLASSTS